MVILLNVCVFILKELVATNLNIRVEGTVPSRGAGTVLVAACPMLLLVNTVSGRRSFHKQSPEFYI